MRVGRAVVELAEGDITALEVDAIVNPANAALQLGGGVAGAIARRGGPEIQRACNAIGGTPVGTAVLTPGGKLPAKYVIHAVGPRWGEGDEAKKLAGATRASLTLADEKGLSSIAFPAISTGIFGYPIDEAARVMIETIRAYLGGPGSRRGPLDRVIVCLFGQPALRTFETELRRQTTGEGA